MPKNAEKPTDPRKKGSGQESFLNSLKEPSIPNLMPLMNTSFYPGSCMDYLQSMKTGPKKQIAFAEYYYFSGHPEGSQKIYVAMIPQKETTVFSCRGSPIWGIQTGDGQATIFMVK